MLFFVASENVKFYSSSQILTSVSVLPARTVVPVQIRSIATPVIVRLVTQACSVRQVRFVLVKNVYG